MNTHYAIVAGGRVIGTRSSASRHPGGTGRYTPYTHALAARDADGTIHALTYHGSEALARQAFAQTNQREQWRRTYPGRAPAQTFQLMIVPVVITPRRLMEGAAVDAQAVQS